MATDTPSPTSQAGISQHQTNVQHSSVIQSPSSTSSHCHSLTSVIQHFSFLVLAGFSCFPSLKKLGDWKLGPHIASHTIYYKFIKFQLSASLLSLDRSSQ